LDSTNEVVVGLDDEHAASALAPVAANAVTPAARKNVRRLNPAAAGMLRGGIIPPV
jgi:hypothetical protein